MANSQNNCTHVSTESLEHLYAYPNNDRWIADRALFLMSVFDRMPEYFFADGQTINEYMDRFNKSLSHELLTIREKYPKHYAFAYKKAIENWLKEE